MQLRFMKLISVLLSIFPLFCTADAKEEKTKVIDWWENAVIYHLDVRCVKDSDGDGIGDLKGITENIDYLHQLHVDAVCLTQIFATDPPFEHTGINKILGTMENFEELINAAEKKGIKVILDFEPRYTSKEHEWFVKSVNREDPYTDYYLWHNGIEGDDGITRPPSGWFGTYKNFGWTWNNERRQYYMHYVTSSEPALNYSNPHVLKEIQEVFDFWYSKGVLGFRIKNFSFLTSNRDFSEQVNNSLLTHKIINEWKKRLDKDSGAKRRVEGFDTYVLNFGENFANYSLKENQSDHNNIKFYTACNGSDVIESAVVRKKSVILDSNDAKLVEVKCRGKIKRSPASDIERLQADQLKNQRKKRNNYTSGGRGSDRRNIPNRNRKYNYSSSKSGSRNEGKNRNEEQPPSCALLRNGIRLLMKIRNTEGWSRKIRSGYSEGYELLDCFRKNKKHGFIYNLLDKRRR